MLPVKLLLLLCFSTCSYAARILAVVFIPSLSHNLVFRPIYRELSLRGHQVVAVAPNPLNDSSLTNLTEIDVSYVYERNKNIQSTLNFDSYTDFWDNTFQWMMLSAEDILKDSRVQQLCEGGDKFDLVLLEALLPVFYAFGTKCDAPTVGMISMDGMLSTHTVQGNPIHPILFGDMLLSYHKPLSLMEKTWYVYYFIWYKWYYNYRVVPQCDSMVRKYLGQQLPPLEEIEANSSMAFINTNVVMNSIRPMSPTVVPMGFVQIRPPNPLSQDLQSVLDDAKQGAVYFSFGSNTQSSHCRLFIIVLRYHDRVCELKSIVEDQPMTGLERAVWWSEYVIRHRGARHLRSAVADVSLAEYLLLDVLAAALSVLLIAGIVSYKLARLVGKLTFCGCRRNKQKES
ncbi:UDP-glucosyltransferase 2-like [Cylas formicarius]|uniref:UDP-glucosyltransferase 2-like n=1 Tax=Cylas formicarius TaxID=197179 RepID=UPI00295836DD|nr:UDP-glucosyltransferase 2-like [Cylas formicarius]